MGEVANDVLKSLDPRIGDTYKHKILDLESQFEKRIKSLPELRKENPYLLIKNELIECLPQLVSGQDASFSRSILCVGCNHFVRVWRFFPKKIVPKHNCHGFSISSEDLNDSMNKEVLIPVNDDVKESMREMQLAKEHAERRKKAVDEYVKVKYFNKQAAQLVGVVED